jgi:hypothetical protein
MKKSAKKLVFATATLSLGLVLFMGNPQPTKAQRDTTNTCKWNGVGCPKATMGCICL